MTLQRTETFVPLTAAPASNEKQEFRVTVIPQARQLQSFQSLEHAAPKAIGAQKKLCEPHLSVQRTGDRVTSIRIQCTCGQIMDIACVYDHEPKAS